MTSLRACCLSLCATLFLLTRLANAGCVEELKDARPTGAGAFCVLGFCLYDARLYAAAAPGDMTSPLALELTYRHHFTAKQLVDAGEGELERLAGKSLSESTRLSWRTDMSQAFSDVSAGDVLCGVYLPGTGVRFYRNGTPTVSIADPAFARAFFGIWLDPRTRAPSLRKKLIGESPS